MLPDTATARRHSEPSPTLAASACRVPRTGTVFEDEAVPKAVAVAVGLQKVDVPH
jgi:hypothetical protein